MANLRDHGKPARVSRLFWLVIAWPIFSFSQDILENTGEASITTTLRAGSIAQNFGKILVDLQSDGLLVVDPVDNTDGLTVIELLVRRNQIVGRSISNDHDHLLCQLNQHVCRSIWRAREDGSEGYASIWFNQESTASGGRKLTDLDCPNNSLPKHVICLPIYDVQSEVTTALRKVSPREIKLSDLVVFKLNGCESFHDECKETIRFLNEIEYPSDNIFDPAFEGELRLPVLARSITYPIASHTSFEDAFDRLETSILELSKANRIPGIFDKNQIAYIAVENPLDPLGPTTLSESEAVTQGLQDMGLPEILDNTNVDELSGVIVGVWESNIDLDHCEFSSTHKILLTEPVQPHYIPRSRAAKCATEVNDNPFLMSSVDHGTLIAGIIFAERNGDGIVGLHPAAGFWYQQTSGALLKDPLSKLLLTGLRAQVVNISAKAAGFGADNLEVALLDFASQTLVVAAAGNSGIAVNNVADCNIFPACWSNNPNPTYKKGSGVISVIALDATGQDLLTALGGSVFSNHGKMFDVAAIGEVVGLGYGDVVLRSRGTSFAAPYVTGLAALIIGKFEKTNRRLPQPSLVKQRILSTSDFHVISDDFVRFGRINFARALQITTGQAKEKECGSDACEFSFDDACILTTQEEDIGAASELVIQSALDVNGSLVSNRRIPFANILRIRRMPDAEESLFWIVEKIGDRAVKYSKATVTDATLQFVSEKTIKTLDIVKKLDDYVPPMLPENLCEATI